jgi:ABC-type branched-subunit amino acid transport system substrate-binding protein
MRTPCMPIVRRRNKRRVALSLAVVPLIVLAACGDDDDDAGDDAGATTPAAETTAGGAPATTAGGAATTAGGTPATTAGGATDTTAAAGSDTTAGEAAAPSGDPIKVMTVAPVNTNLPPYPNIPAAAEIYMQYINDRGGIQGRPLEVITCDDQGDPNVGANCARQAVDEGAVAVVGSFVFDASRIIPVLEENNIPWFGACCPLVEQEFSSPISFPLGSLLPGQGAGIGWKMAQDGCEKPVNVVLDIPAGDVAYPALVNAYEVGGGDPDAWRMVKISAVPGDYSAQVADAISGGTDCIAGGISDSNWAALLPAMASAGADVRLYGLQGNLNSKIAEEFPELTEGGVVSNSYPNIEGPMWDDYRASLEEYNAPDLDWNSLAGLGTWTAYTAFKNVVDGMSGEITNETFLEAINSTTALDTDGMIPELDLTAPYTGFGGGLPRIFNRTVFFDTISGGKLTALDDQAYDMTGPIDGQPMSE